MITHPTYVRPVYIRHLLAWGGILSGIAMGLLIARASGDSDFWKDHSDKVIYGLGQIGTISLMVAYMISHSLTSSQMRRDIDGIGVKLDLEMQRLSSDEGSALEREQRIRGLKERADKLSDRTVELRDTVMDHEGRIAYIEDKLKFARDRAIVKLTQEGRLSGVAWKEDGIDFTSSHSSDDPTTK